MSRTVSLLVLIFISDLQVEVPERVIEGDKVTLTCKTSCSLSDRPTFTWYRNGHPLSSSTDQLHLQSVSREDAGSYHCAVLGLRSPEVTLNVRYLQVEVPERVIEGDNVTLTCKTSFSLSYRPTFTWYRNRHPLSFSTDQLHLQSVSREDAGSYHCAVLDQKLQSPEVTLNVRYGPKNISVSISPSGEIVEGSSVTLTCSSDANPPVQNYTWFKEGGSSPVGSGHSYRALQSGFYYCVALNEHGSQKSAAVTENLYNNVAVRSTTSDAAPDPDPSNQDDVQYASVEPRKVRNPRNAESSAATASAFGADEEVQYASVQHQQVDAQYASVRFSRTGAANR
ncbi:hypothetical protein MHYP_G00100480 [Metynnis hypsauchen]